MVDSNIGRIEWRGGKRKGAGRKALSQEEKKVKEGLKSLKPQTVKDFRDALNDFYSLSKKAVEVLRDSLESEDISQAEKAQLALQMLKKGIPADVLSEHQQTEKASITIVLPGKAGKKDWEAEAKQVLDVAFTSSTAHNLETGQESKESDPR